MKRSTVAVAQFPAWTGVGPPVPNRVCGSCGHREADRHLLDDTGQRAACGAAHRNGKGERVRCRCTRFTPPAGAR
jgi:hypothetical protein